MGRSFSVDKRVPEAFCQNNLWNAGKEELHIDWELDSAAAAVPLELENLLRTIKLVLSYAESMFKFLL